MKGKYTYSVSVTQEPPGGGEPVALPEPATGAVEADNAVLGLRACYGKVVAECELEPGRDFLDATMTITAPDGTTWPVNGPVPDHLWKLEEAEAALTAAPRICVNGVWSKEPIY